MGRTPCKCCHHEAEVMKKGHWEKEEDEKLKEYMSTRKHNGGRISWRGLPKSAGLNRCGKSCRLRWLNYLRDGINRGNFTANEVELIIKLHSQHGNKWSTIAGYLENRTDNEIKNFWNTHIKKKLLRDGIDPDTHQRLPPDVLNEPLPLLTHPGLNSLVPTAHAAAEGARLRDLAGVPIMWQMQMQMLQVQLLQAIASHAVSSSSSNINTTAVANTPPAAVANAMLGYSTMYPNFQDDMNIPRSRANYPVYSRDVFAAGHEMAKQMTSTTTAPIFSSCAAPTTQYCGTARADATSSSGTVFQNYLQDTTYILSPSDFPGFVCDTNSNVARQEIVMPQLNKSTTPVVFNSYAAESTAQYSSAAALVSATSPQQVSAGATDGPAQEGMRQQDLLPLLDESWSEIFARSYHV